MAGINKFALLKADFANLVINRLHKLRLLAGVEQRFLKGWSLPPQQIDVYLTERCNLKCSFCSVNETHSRKPQKEVTFADIEKLVKQVGRYRPLFYLTGGEPFSRKDTIEIIEMIRANGCMVAVVTNGFYVDQALAKRLVKCGVNLVSVSIDGNEETHDRIRGVKGSYSRAVAALRYLKAEKEKAKKPFPLLRINCTTDGTGADSFRHVGSLAAGLGVEMVKYHHLLFVTPQVKETVGKWSRKFGYDDKMIGVFTSETDFNWKDLKGFFQELKDCGKAGMEARQFPEMPLDEIENYYKGEWPSKNAVCLNNYLKALVFANGDVSMCYTKNLTFGNITETPFMDIWNGRKFKEFREILNRDKVIPYCYRCCNMYYRFK